MARRVMILGFSLLAMVLVTASLAQSFDGRDLAMFRALRRLPNPLARYEYVLGKIPKLSPDEQMFAEQFQAFALAELGLYNQAVLSFPLKGSPPPGLVLPDPGQERSVDAIDLITRLAADRRIVMINEAHHNAHTRVLTLALLPRLRKLGFKYFAAEALGDRDPGLMQRGYPTTASGSEYLQEPIYGELVREAIRLGFVIVPYDGSSSVAQVRETEQAENLYRRVFKKDPTARLVVHAGYAHIDKARGRLNDAAPMAMRLAQLTGIDPLSIDQTEFLESGWDTTDDYHELIRRFPTRSPEVLVDRASGKPWSARPALYDFNVLLPPALNMRVFGDTGRTKFGGTGPQHVDDATRMTMDAAIVPNEMERASWLSLGGQRQRWPIDTMLCRNQVPCVVSAYYAGEPDDATPADCYAFIQLNSRTNLYLRPGRYRLRAWMADGRTLSERGIVVGGR